MSTSGRTIRRLVVHHTAGPETASAAEIRAAHRARGWVDIGYHALVRRGPSGDWIVEDGRSDWMMGAHVSGHNEDTLGVAIAGDYSHREPPPEALALAAGVLVGWAARHGLRGADVVGHRELGQTACPGRVPVDRLRAAVDALVDAIGSAHSSPAPAGPTLADARGRP
jgi:hypothetical protein